MALTQSSHTHCGSCSGLSQHTDRQWQGRTLDQATNYFLVFDLFQAMPYDDFEQSCAPGGQQKLGNNPTPFYFGHL